MPRKRKQPTAIKYLVPENAIEKVEKLVHNSTRYRRKEIWIQKFYHLFDYIATQNCNKDLSSETGYVNIHMATMARNLSIDNRQMSAMLKDAVGVNILKKDGIMKKAVIAKSSFGDKFIEKGKSYGYQFVDMDILTDVEVTDNRCMCRNSIARHEEKLITQKDLKVYQEVISEISIDTEGIEKTFRLILDNKVRNAKSLENYRKFIRKSEYLCSKKNNITYCLTVPFGGVIVPKKTVNFDRKTQSGNSVLCEPCTFNVTYCRDGEDETSRYIEPDSMTMARCNKAIFVINEGYMVVTRPVQHSRVYCAVTHLNRELREHLRLKGKRVAGIDIRNSQPLIACIVIRRYWLDKLGYLPDDVLRYQAACESGGFYDDFMQALNLPTTLRSEFKADFFAKVFFSMVTEKENILKSMFIERYPSVWEMVCDEKGGLYSRNYGEFASTLQKVEATIIFDNVNMELLRTGIKAFNIFDSIYVRTREDYVIALKLMNQAFNELGLNPSFNTEGIENLDD